MSQPSDPVALRSPRACRFFAGVMRRQMQGGFRAVRIAEPGVPELPDDRPVMVYANHPSWWDPVFFAVLISEVFPGREGYGPIDAAMLERYRFMRRIGIFGITPDSARGAAEFLRTGGRILSDPRRMLWITAQGGFVDPRVRPVALRGGAARLMARTPDLIAVPLAVEYPFWSEKRPEALARFGTPLTSQAGETPEALAARLSGALEATMDQLATAAMARDPAAFRRICGGTSGVGGVYGGWQKLRSALTGRRHVADHLEET